MPLTVGAIGRRIGWAAAFAVAATANARPVAEPSVSSSANTTNLNINPKRITFDRLGKSATIYVYNPGGGTTSFDVQLVDRVMLPSGQIVPLADAEAKPELKPFVDRVKSARPLLIATPRRVTLAANTGQTIRVRASSPADVPAGEYRTHLTVTALPPPSAGLTAEQAAAPRAGQLSFHVDSVLGLSIPVIVRVGPQDVRAGIEAPRITSESVAATGDSPPTRTGVLSFDLVRLGANSLFGDVEVRGAKERGGDKPPLGVVRGIGVYPEIERRSVRILLRRLPAPGEKIDIVFRDDDTMSGNDLAHLTVVAP